MTTVIPPPRIELQIHRKAGSFLVQHMDFVAASDDSALGAARACAAIYFKVPENEIDLEADIATGFVSAFIRQKNP